MKSKLWLTYALVTTLFWGIWGAFIGLPAENGFPRNVGLLVSGALTMIPPAFIAFETHRLETAIRQQIHLVWFDHRLPWGRRADGPVSRRHRGSTLSDFPDHFIVACDHHRSFFHIPARTINQTGSAGYITRSLSPALCLTMQVVKARRNTEFYGSFSPLLCWQPGAYRPSS